MSERKPKNLSRRLFLEGSVGAVVGVSIGCGGDDNGTTSAAGSGGQQPGGTGGSTGGNATGGLPTETGGSLSSSGGSATGGTATGGASTGGVSTGGVSTGGQATGGADTTGGAAGTGGVETTGGVAGTGGVDTTGGAAGTGGENAGGANTGGEGTGGTGPTEDALVTLVRASDWKQATMDAVLARLPDLTGQRVMVRPNVIEGKPDGTTNPAVIAGVVAAAKQKGASEIIVGEDAFTGDAASFMQTLGITDAVGSDATCVSLAGGATSNHSDANAAAWPSGIDIYDAVKNADYVINVPRCKTHGIAGFSMALKAWFGSLQRPGDLHTEIHNKIAEAHLARQENLVVLDATRCMTTGGPTQGGTMADSNIVAVTEDAIAADVTGVAIVRYFGASLAVPWTLNQIRRAMALGFPGWLTEQTDFSYTVQGDISEADDIMAKRSA